MLYKKIIYYKYNYIFNYILIKNFKFNLFYNKIFYIITDKLKLSIKIFKKCAINNWIKVEKNRKIYIYRYIKIKSIL